MSRQRQVSLLLPASSANLGPAFDTAALALDLYLKVEARPASQFKVTARGRDADLCQAADDHLILTTYRDLLHTHDLPVEPLLLKLINQIPIGKGCGSSAAARLAGIALAVHFGRLGWDSARIIAEAAAREHHPDNAAACWLGGFAIARMTGRDDVHAVALTPRGRCPLLLAVPDDTLPTEQARRVLPVQYSRTDTVSNLQNSLLLMAALIQGRRDLLPYALHDHLHQPYRASLCPLLPALQELVGSAGILGAVLSGAGPSVLLFLDGVTPLAKTRKHIGEHLRDHGLVAELLPTGVAAKGAAASFAAV